MSTEEDNLSPIIAEILQDDFLKEIVTDLELSLKNTYHITLVSGSELIGEIFTDIYVDSNNENKQDHLIINPIKVLRDSYISEDGIWAANHYFVEYNPCSEGPYLSLSPSSIMTMTNPNKETMIAYILAVYDQYYPVSDEIILQNDDGEEIMLLTLEADDNGESKSNVIDFSAYLNRKRSNGIS